jgi:diamine N-acetyltransferase
MSVTLQPITEENWRICIGLEPAPDQRRFVAPNVYSLTEAQFYPAAQTRAIYADETMVGFVVWGIGPQEPPGTMWISRLMIDQRYQGRGYGRTAMLLVMDEIIHTVPECHVIKLRFEPENTIAEALYLSLGFEHTGEMIQGEAVMERDARRPVRVIARD